MSGLTSPLSEAAVVVGEAEESEEEDLEAKEDSKSTPTESKADSPQRDEETKSSRLGDARASLASLRLSSVTATVERTLGSLPSIELPHWAPATSNKSPTGVCDHQLRCSYLSFHLCFVILCDFIKTSRQRG